MTGELGRAVLHEIVAAARCSGKPFHQFNDKSEMTAKEAIELYKLFDQHGIKVWIDGGWGVDALLGHQTRKHDDLDIAVQHSNLSTLCNLLEGCGYRHVPSSGCRACNFILADDQGHRIDVHSFEIGSGGENTFGVAYRAEHLTGAGMIDGFQVRCVAPDWMVKSIRVTHSIKAIF